MNIDDVETMGDEVNLLCWAKWEVLKAEKHLQRVAQISRPSCLVSFPEAPCHCQSGKDTDEELEMKIEKAVDLLPLDICGSSASNELQLQCLG